MNDKYLQRVLGNQEKVIFVTRQHIFYLIGDIILEILILGAIILGVIFLFPFNGLALLGLFFAIIPIASILRDYLNWNNKQYVVTNRRVIHSWGIFSKNIVDSSLEKVNDVKMEQSFIGRILNFGNVEILTASELGVNIFSNIGDPIKFKTAMLDAKELLTMENGETVRKERGEDIPDLIEKLGKLMQKGVVTEAEFQEKKKDLLAKL